MTNELISKYEQALREDGAENTIVRYIQVANQFIEWYQELIRTNTFDPNNVSALDLQQWKKYLINEATFQRGNGEAKYAISSVNNCIVSIRTFFSSLKDMEVIKKNPAVKLKTQKINEDFDSEPRWLERNERNNLFG